MKEEMNMRYIVLEVYYRGHTGVAIYETNDRDEAEDALAAAPTTANYDVQLWDRLTGRYL
jgi:hypothetical protein